MSAIRGIVFDKDGTLFDFSRTWEQWAQNALTRLAHVAQAPDMIDIMGAAIGYNLSSGKFARDSVVIAGTPREVAEALDTCLPDMSLPDIILILNQEAARAPQSEAAPLVPLLTELRQRGLRLGVATNDAEAPACAHLEQAGIADFFDFVAGFDSGYGAKPQPGQLLGFCEATGCAAATCLMVGDSRHDLAAGRAAGFGTVGVLTGMAQVDDLRSLADVIMPDIGKLPAWLDR